MERLVSYRTSRPDKFIAQDLSHLPKNLGIKPVKIRSGIIIALFIISLLAANCSLQKNAPIQEQGVIEWKDLQITPRTGGDLCKEILPDDIDTGEEIQRDFPSGPGILSGFFPESLSVPHKIAYDTYWIDPSKQLLLNWLFWYPEGNMEPLILRLFVLLDDSQLSNALPELGKYNDIHLEPGNDKSITVTIPPLSPGVHDVIAVGIPYPENEPDEYGRLLVIYRQITLIVGETPPHPFRTIDFTTPPAEGSIKQDDPAMTLELTVKKDGIDVWNWPQPWLDIQENTPLTFYALGGHQDVTNLDAPAVEPLKSSFSAFLLFVDYQQIEIAPAQTALYAKMDSDTAYARLPITLHPLPAGKHHILVLRIDTPGVPMCILWDNPDKRILPHSIYGRLVGLNVLPEP